MDIDKSGAEFDIRSSLEAFKTTQLADETFVRIIEIQPRVESPATLQDRVLSEQDLDGYLLVSIRKLVTLISIALANPGSRPLAIEVSDGHDLVMLSPNIFRHDY